MTPAYVRKQIFLIAASLISSFAPTHAARIAEHAVNPSMAASSAVPLREYLNHDVGRTLLSDNPGLRAFAAGYRIETEHELRALSAMDAHLPPHFIREFAVARMAYKDAPVADALRLKFLAAYELAGDHALREYEQRLKEILTENSDDPARALTTAYQELAAYSLYGQKLGRRVDALKNVAAAASLSNEMKARAQELASRLLDDHSYWQATDPSTHHGYALVSDHSPVKSALLAPSQQLLHNILAERKKALIDRLPPHSLKTAQAKERTAALDLVDLAVAAPFDDITESILHALLALRQTVNGRIETLTKIGHHPSERIFDLVLEYLSKELRVARGNSHVEARISAAIQTVTSYHNSKDASMAKIGL